jgi:hypothetical protein
MEHCRDPLDDFSKELHHKAPPNNPTMRLFQTAPPQNSKKLYHRTPLKNSATIPHP